MKYSSQRVQIKGTWFRGNLETHSLLMLKEHSENGKIEEKGKQRQKETERWEEKL